MQNFFYQFACQIIGDSLVINVSPFILSGQEFESGVDVWKKEKKLKKFDCRKYLGILLSRLKEKVLTR